MQHFSERLIALRKERGITQYKFAEIINKQRSTISGYESEGKEPDFTTLCLMADFFGVTTDYLLGRDEERAHADVVFRNDNTNFKKHFDVLSPELKAIVTDAFDFIYIMFSQCMRDRNATELTLYRDLMDELQKKRGDLKQLVSGSTYSLVDAFSQIMELHNSLKATMGTILDSLLQSDIDEAKSRKHK